MSFLRACRAFDDLCWHCTQRMCVVCCRDIREQDVQKALQQVNQQSKGELNNRPLIGVLSQVGNQFLTF